MKIKKIKYAKKVQKKNSKTEISRFVFLSKRSDPKSGLMKRNYYRNHATER